MNPENAQAIFEQADVDGGLIGGASLDEKICGISEIVTRGIGLMENIILIIHFIIAILIIGFVLIQQGKGAEAGASFGAGASQTVLVVVELEFFQQNHSCISDSFFCYKCYSCSLRKK